MGPRVNTILIVFLVAFFVTYLAVPFSKWLGHKIGALDHPGRRRINTTVIPRCGGVALYLGLLAGCCVLYIGCSYFGWRDLDLYTTESINPKLLLVGVSTMFALGLVDDIVQLRASTKFVFQLIAASIVVAAGVSIGSVRLLEGAYLELGWLNAPLTILYLVTFVNVINLIDGMDGLAAGITAICAAGLLYMVWMRGSFTLVLICVILIAVCLAFLRYNFYPATVFMGDSGALLLGFILGIVSITGVIRTQSLIVMVVPLAIAAIPILDTLSAILRRWRKHLSIGQADKEHIHHKLLETGMGQIRSVLVLYILTAVATFAGCALGSVSGYARLAVLAVLAAGAFFITWKLGLSKKVTRHHYRNKGKTGPRIARLHSTSESISQPNVSDTSSTENEPSDLASDAT